MRRLTYLLLLLTFALTSNAATFKYKFKDIPLSKAITTLISDHPQLNINFIYNDLENYRVSANIDTDDPMVALQKLVGLNPVTISTDGTDYFMEALQHGKFIYTGRAQAPDGAPVEAATVILLNPRDSTAITYGITNAAGKFSIPCDREGVIAKLSCLGYVPTFRNLKNFNAGTIIMTPYHTNLKVLEVNPDYASLYPDKTVFVPSQRQKNASQSATDLISRMAIPQLKLGTTQTVSGEKVDIFIDYLPADNGDLSGMKMSDVVKVEYYDAPADPRFHNKPYVINFIMKKYEYGGYLKGYVDQNFGYNSGVINAYGKLQYKKMTYDLRIATYHKNYSHTGYEKTETFRLPDEDGNLETFSRVSTTKGAKDTENDEWTSFKATYKSDKVTMRNTIGADFTHYPSDNRDGTVSYSPEVASPSEFTTNSSNYINSYSYFGNWAFYLPKNNTITFYPTFAYSHTKLFSEYIDKLEKADYANRGRDDSFSWDFDLTYQHSFPNKSNLSATVTGNFLNSKTIYEGTADATDHTHTYLVNPSVNYNIRIKKVYASMTAGMNWSRVKFGNVLENTWSPWGRISGNYAPNKKNRVNASFSFNRTTPASSYRSDVIIEENPLMSYTGNPLLTPTKNYSGSLSYTYYPSRKFYFSLYGNSRVTKNRYAYDYVPFDGKILRKIMQPAGNYSYSSVGVNTSLSFFDNNLQIDGNVSYDMYHLGIPSDWNKNAFNFSLQCFYYLKNFDFSAMYVYPSRRAVSLTGEWTKSRPIYYLTAGWSNSSWNIRTVFNAFATWSWKKGNYSRMHSEYYDIENQETGYGHAFFKIAATYTFGFGKEVRRGDEVNRISGADPAILK